VGQQRADRLQIENIGEGCRPPVSFLNSLRAAPDLV
jgi:hypothetical protein